ncbi:MAG: DUF1549 and DUF1553 domain-containing protein, partial [Thermoleophilia bacterium]|nr:DUF1549 and DUF1553 domain-containing protein [Thermoleophilia bacterium]
MRQETGELSVSLAAPGGVPVIVGSDGHLTLTDEDWTGYVASETVRLHAFDNDRRRTAARSEDAYWARRHEAARQVVGREPAPAPPGPDGAHLIDRYMADALKSAGVTPPAPADDAAFFRRLALDVTGVIPDPKALAAFLADPSPDRRAKAIDAMLADPRWADGWMGYWQDVLAENPGILKPTLNNTGPFRKYLHAAFLDNRPADRLVTELARMGGSPLGGGPAGFGIASQNDAPMAAKAQILAKAFLAADLKCARCHDAPSHPYDQSDLFGLAGMLEGKPVAVPATSTVRSLPGGRTPAVSITLKAGEVVAPHWNLTDIGDASADESLLPEKATPRDTLALLITSPENRRFAPVMVNRLWKKYMGVGLVEPVDDWDDSPKALHPDLLAALARQFVLDGYDLKKLARLILTSATYQAEVRPTPPGDDGRLSIAAIPARRRLTAEQVLDSMFAAVGKPFRAEELNLDPDGRRPPADFLNLGVPTRAWLGASSRALAISSPPSPRSGAARPISSKSRSRPSAYCC